MNTLPSLIPQPFPIKICTGAGLFYPAHRSHSRSKVWSDWTHKASSSSGSRGIFFSLPAWWSSSKKSNMTGKTSVCAVNPHPRSDVGAGRPWPSVRCTECTVLDASCIPTSPSRNDAQASCLDQGSVAACSGTTRAHTWTIHPNPAAQDGPPDPHINIAACDYSEGVSGQ